MHSFYSMRAQEIFFFTCERIIDRACRPNSEIISYFTSLSRNLLPSRDISYREICVFYLGVRALLGSLFSLIRFHRLTWYNSEKMPSSPANASFIEFVDQVSTSYRTSQCFRFLDPSLSCHLLPSRDVFSYREICVFYLRLRALLGSLFSLTRFHQLTWYSSRKCLLHLGIHLPSSLLTKYLHHIVHHNGFAFLTQACRVKSNLLGMYLYRETCVFYRGGHALLGSLSPFAGFHRLTWYNSRKCLLHLRMHHQTSSSP